MSAPTQYSDGDFTLQVGTDAINSDVYISRNLIVDGLIHGNITGDVSDTHIETQSLLVHQLSAGGLEGIEVRDNFDIKMYDNQAGNETARLILYSSTGSIRLNNAGSSETINLNGQTGDITLKTGDIKLNQSIGDITRILLDSSAGQIRLYNSSGAELLNLNGQTGDITGSGGDVILEDGSGTETIRLDASAGCVEATSVSGESSGFHIKGRGGIFDGATVVTSEGTPPVAITTKSFIENVDFGATNNWNLAGRSFRKVWMPVKNASGLQVRWTYTAVKTNESNNWHDASGEYDAAGTMTGRGLLDINNRFIRTSKIKAKITMNCACNYQLGFRLLYKHKATLPITDAFTQTYEYLVVGDDWTDGDSPEYLGRKQWTFEYPLFPTTAGHWYSFRPEFFIKYAPEPLPGKDPAPPASYPANFARVQFWVGSAVGNPLPTEKTNSDMPAIFEIIEMPEEQTEFLDTAGTYPSASEALLTGGFHHGDYVPPSSSSSSDDY